MEDTRLASNQRPGLWRMRNELFDIVGLQRPSLSIARILAKMPRRHGMRTERDTGCSAAMYFRTSAVAELVVIDEVQQVSARSRVRTSGSHLTGHKRLLRQVLREAVRWSIPAPLLALLVLET